MYEWIDPFAEIERQKLEAMRAYERVQAAVFRLLQSREMGPALKRAVLHLAERTAREVVKPHMAQTPAEFARREREERRVADKLLADTESLVRAISDGADLTLAESYASDAVVLSYGVEKPFRFNVSIQRR